jgi:hypothetical protein
VVLCGTWAETSVAPSQLTQFWQIPRQNAFLFPVLAMFSHDCFLAMKPASTPRRLVHKRTLIRYLLICSFLLCVGCCAVEFGSSGRTYELPRTLLKISYGVSRKSLSSMRADSRFFATALRTRQRAAVYLFDRKLANGQTSCILLSFLVPPQQYLAKCSNEFVVIFCVFTVCPREPPLRRALFIFRTTQV